MCTFLLITNIDYKENLKWGGMHLIYSFLCKKRCVLLQDVPGAAEAGGPHGEVHVPLHRSLHVGGCGAAWEGDGGKSSLVLGISQV